LEPEPFNPAALAQLEVGDEAAALAQIDSKTLDQITDAPLFSMDRKPFEPPIDPGTDPGGGDPPVEPEPLKARVTSIIITPENSYAMVFDELSNSNVTLKQGMPLPGEQGLWLLDTINPRAVTFVADGEEPVELSLEVFDGQLNAAVANNRNRNRDKAANKRNKDANKDQPKKNSAEEIRRKIAERRAQMRANAAKGKEE